MAEFSQIKNDSNFTRFGAMISSYEIRSPFCRRSFVDLRRNENLASPQLLQLLYKFANGDDVFPANFWMYEGRSLYAELGTEAQTKFEIAGIKMKGGAGLVYKEDRSRSIELPRPLEDYTWFNEPHLALKADFSPYIIESKGKGLNALTAQQALRDYEAHELLSSINLSLRPLMVGKFQIGDEPELDLNGTPTGCVFIETSSRLKMLGQLIGFEALHAPDSFSSQEITFLHSRGSGDFRGLLLNHHQLIHKALETKRRAIDAFGLIRHVGHLDNFIYDPDRHAIYLSDLDSVGLLAIDRNIDAKAASIVRDIASDTNRIVSGLTQRCFSLAYLSISREEIPKYNPFLPCLHGYFGADVSFPLILNAANRLLDRYLGFINANVETLMPMHLERHTSRVNHQPNSGINSARWRMIHTNFIGNILSEVLPLYRASKLSEKYPIPESATDERSLEYFNSAGPLLFSAFEREMSNYAQKVSNSSPSK